MSSNRKASEVDYAGSRCPVCFWALYDGYRCQNPKCDETVVEKAVYLTNAEAQLEIKKKEALEDPESFGAGTGSPVD